MKAWSLEAVIDPVSTEDFFSAYFESQRLLVRRNRPDFFEELLTLDDVDRILTTAQSTREEVAVVNAANKIKTADYVYGNDRVKVDQLFRLHEAGGTIILNHLHRRHPPLAKLCAALELEFSAPFQTNIYLTPPKAQGFHPHFDTHDVLVLQLAGSKRWQLYGTPIVLALKGHGDYARQDNPGPVSEEFDLRAGDTLYLPRGLVPRGDIDGRDIPACHGRHLVVDLVRFPARGRRKARFIGPASPRGAAARIRPARLRPRRLRQGVRRARGAPRDGSRCR
jgi:ribosomal protein L16 Arg81 hydroxylase